MDNFFHIYTVNREIYWGILISTYFFYTGMSAGSFVLSSLGGVFGIEKFKAVAKSGVLMAIVLLAFAPLHLIADLAQPSRFWHLLVNFEPTSAMSYGVILLMLYPLNLIIYAWFLFREDMVKRLEEKNWRSTFYRWLTFGQHNLDEQTLNRDKKMQKLFGTFGVPLALLVHGYTGFILADVQTRALWHTGLMPFIFLMSAMVSGTGLFIIVLLLVERYRNGGLTPQIRSLIVDMGQLMKWFIVVDASMMFTHFVMLWYGNSEAYAAGYFLIRGAEQFSFLGIEVGLGLVIPFVILSIPKIKESLFWIVLASIFTIIGVYAMRYNFVVGGQKIPLTGDQILEYKLESFDLSITLLIAALAIGTLIFAYNLLPMNHKYTISNSAKESSNLKGKGVAR